MRRDATAALRLTLQGHLSLRKSRLESFCVLVVGVLLSRTVLVAQEPPGKLLRPRSRCPAIPHRQSEPSCLHVSHAGRDRLELPPSPTLLRTGHRRRKPARPCAS